MKRGRVFLVLIILVFSISFISAGFFSDFWNYMTGRATATCPDSDANSNYPTGLDYNTYGAFGGTNYHDYCVNETTSRQLKEIYCTSSGTPTIITYTCSIACQSGACVGCVDYYADADSDGYGNSSDKQCLTIIQGIYKVTQTGDCNDGNSTIKPGATEACGDGVDNDCDSTIDEGCTTTTPETAPASSAPEATETIPEIADETPTINAELTQEFEGYIVELEGKPLIERELELEEQAETNEGNVVTQAFGRILPSSIAPATQDNVDEKISDAITELGTERESAMTRIKNELGKTSIITGSAVENPEENLIVLNEYEIVFNGFTLNISSEEAEEIKNVTGIKSVTPNYILRPVLMDSIPQINADDVWRIDANGNNCATSGQACLTGQGVTIGILDTGVDYHHPDLGGCLGENCKVVGGWDFYSGDHIPLDDYGHGTHVAAIAAGNGVLKGVAPDAKIYAYKVCSAWGTCSVASVIAALERSVDPNQDGNFADHVDIVSLSLGGPGSPDDPQSTAVDRAVSAGIVAVVSAGNSGPGEDTIGSPGTARKAITVGVINKNNHIADFSSRGPVRWVDSSGEQTLSKPDIVAPGIDICAAEAATNWIPDTPSCLDSEHILMSGTSMAGPHVAGAVALLLQKNPNLTPDEVKNILKSNALNLGYDINTQGAGKLDTLNFIQSTCDGTDTSCGSFGNCVDCTQTSFFECSGTSSKSYNYKCVNSACVRDSAPASVVDCGTTPAPTYQCSASGAVLRYPHFGKGCDATTGECYDRGRSTSGETAQICGTTPEGQKGCTTGDRRWEKAHRGAGCLNGECYDNGWDTQKTFFNCKENNDNICINGECSARIDGSACLRDVACESNHCVGFICRGPLPNGYACWKDWDCISGKCRGLIPPTCRA